MDRAKPGPLRRPLSLYMHSCRRNSLAKPSWHRQNLRTSPVTDRCGPDSNGITPSKPNRADRGVAQRKYPPHQAKRRYRADPKDPSIATKPAVSLKRQAVSVEVILITNHLYLLSFLPMPIPSEKQLLEHACHFGHPKAKWNPKIAPYLYGTRKGIHIFNLEKTRHGLIQVVDALKALQAEGKTVLIVSTKQQAIPLIEDMGHKLGQPVVTKKWIPGLLTNWPTIKRRLQYYLDLRRSFQTGEVEKYTKKEQTALRKELAKLDAALSGVASMNGLPDALFVVDGVRDHVAVLEAKKLGIPVYGICDSNANPDEFTACIPANDDAVRSIQLLLDTVADELASVRSKKEVAKEKAPAEEAPRAVISGSY
jgi:small subunit ribosomal protein S2